MNCGSIEIITGPMFSGKCLGVNTPVMMYNGGIKKVQDVKKGDLLMGDDSASRKVSSTTFGYGQLYKIKQTNGMEYVVNQYHILSLKNKYNRSVVDIKLMDYLKKTNEFRSVFKGYRVQPDFKYTVTGTRPYIEGKSWDGSKDFKIPKCIKINSLRVREEWLTGHLEHHGVYQSYQDVLFFVDIKNWTSDNISDYIKMLQSTGLSFIIKNNELQIFGNFLHEFGWIKLKNKVLQQSEYNPNENMSDILVENIGEGEYYGFTLDKNHRFLLEDGTVTHNTTELMKRLNRDVYAKRNILYINHSLDNRSKNTIYSTHNPMINNEACTIPLIKMKSYRELPTIKEVSEYDTIGVDEAQFFDDLDNIKDYANNGKRVIVSGLTSDSNQNKFGCITDLLPVSENCEILNAICVKCIENNVRRDAAFTIKIHSESSENQIDIGSDDKYIPVCRYHINN